MDKKQEMQFNLNNFLLSTSLLFDKAERNYFNTKVFHSKKIAYVALKIAQGFDFSKEELSDLCSFCLCHNIAINYEEKDSKEQFEKAEELISNLPFHQNYENILKYQREFYNGSGLYGIKGGNIPLFSQIICFIDILDRKFELSDESIKNRKIITNYVEKNYGVLFSPIICDIFLSLFEQIDFCLELQNENDMVYFIYTSLSDFTLELKFEKILEIIVKFFDVNKKILSHASLMADFYNFEHKDKQQFLIASSLCDIGKIPLRNNIIKKVSELNEDEKEELKAYPFYTKKVLSNILGFKDISILSSRVQESLDYEGYPYNLGAKDLSFKERLLSCLHKYNALCTNKIYRNSFNHEESINVLISKKFKSKVDQCIVNEIAINIKNNL